MTTYRACPKCGKAAFGRRALPDGTHFDCAGITDAEGYKALFEHMCDHAMMLDAYLDAYQELAPAELRDRARWLGTHNLEAMRKRAAR